MITRHRLFWLFAKKNKAEKMDTPWQNSQHLTTSGDRISKTEPKATKALHGSRLLVFRPFDG